MSEEKANEMMEQMENLPLEGKSADEAADEIVDMMVATIAVMAAIPAHVNWIFVITAMCTGVVAIGRCYGVQLTRDEAWKLIRQLFLAAGFTFMGLTLGSRFISVILTSTGLGYFGAVALDAAVFCPLAYAVGACAKAHFRDDLHKKNNAQANAELGKMLKAKFYEKKAEQEQQANQSDLNEDAA